MAGGHENIFETSPHMRVMVCIDDSANAKLAFGYYVNHFHRVENEVIVLHVSGDVKVPTYLYVGGAFSGGVPNEIESSIEEVRQRNQAIENEYNSKCTQRKIKNKVLIVARGECGGVGPAIVNAAKKHNATLIVVGSRGLGKIRRTILGCVVSTKILGMAPKVYYDLMSQPCRAVYIFLKCAGIPFESKVVALRKGEHHTEEYLKIHPFGKVPALDDGFTMTERLKTHLLISMILSLLYLPEYIILSPNVAILRYLSDKYAKSDSWYPKELQTRAKVDEYCAWQHGEMRLKCAKVFLNEVIMPGGLGDTESLVANMNVMLDNFERVFLKDKPFIAGDTITVADLLAACEMSQTEMSGRDILTGRPKLQRWMERVKNATSPYFDEAHAVCRRVRERQIKKKANL